MLSYEFWYTAIILVYLGYREEHIKIAHLPYRKTQNQTESFPFFPVNIAERFLVKIRYRIWSQRHPQFERAYLKQTERLTIHSLILNYPKMAQVI